MYTDSPQEIKRTFLGNSNNPNSLEKKIVASRASNLKKGGENILKYKKELPPMVEIGGS